MFIQSAKEYGQRVCQDAGILIMRLALGIFFLFHGGQKLFGIFDGLGLGGFAGLIEAFELPFPSYIAVAIAGTEFVGGMMLILGFYCRVGAALLATCLFVTAYFAYENATGVFVEQTVYPLNLCYLLVGLGVTLLGLTLTGAGRFAIGTLLTRLPSVTQTQTQRPAQTQRPELHEPRTILG